MRNLTTNCAPRDTTHKAAVRIRAGHGNVTVTTVRPSVSSLTYAARRVRTTWARIMPIPATRALPVHHSTTLMVLRCGAVTWTLRWLDDFRLLLLLGSTWSDSVACAGYTTGGTWYKTSTWQASHGTHPPAVLLLWYCTSAKYYILTTFFCFKNLFSR